VSKTPEDELMLEHDKMIVMAHNESALGYIFGKDTARRLIDDDGAVMWFHGDHPNETYSQNLAKKRAREKVKDSQETSRDTAHTLATIDIMDFLNSWYRVGCSPLFEWPSLKRCPRRSFIYSCEIE
jgi:hypothetical protein